jgi:hypothetical protein
MISTFQNTFVVDVEIDGLTAIFEGREPASGSGTVIALRHTPAGWFTAAETAFLIVLENRKIGWVESRFCKARKS